MASLTRPITLAALTAVVVAFPLAGSAQTQADFDACNRQGGGPDHGGRQRLHHERLAGPVPRRLHDDRARQHRRQPRAQRERSHQW